MNERKLYGLSLRLISSVLNLPEDNFEKTCQSVNVVNILDVIGKKLFWAGFFWVGAEIGVSAKWSYLATPATHSKVYRSNSKTSAKSSFFSENSMGLKKYAKSLP